MKKLQKLKGGDKVAIVSPSFAASGRWPEVHNFGLERLKNIFGLEPVMYPATSKLGASLKEKAEDLQAAFADPEIKAVIATLGGDIQVTYIKNLNPDVFSNNPKPFFGYSDNSHFENFLFLNDVPSFYGASLFTQFAMQGEMDEYTIKYIKHALFDEGEFELLPSEMYNDMGLGWDNLHLLNTKRTYEESDGWFWDGEKNAEGLLWGGCVESVDEMLRHGVAIPSLEQFKDIILMLETSEEIPTADYVSRVIRAFGERGILKNVKGVLMGRPKAWEFGKPATTEEKELYRAKQRETVLSVVRKYNADIPVVQNVNFGHTDPQIPMPYGGMVRIETEDKRIFANF